MDGLGAQHQGLDMETDVTMDAPPLVRFDERRLHVRAYNYWASLLGDRAFPSIDDLNPAEIEDFGPHSVLLDFTEELTNPAVAFLGSGLMRECGLDGKIGRIRDVPPRTLLSRLTDHYLQIIANQAPIGFEAEFTNQRGAEILYRGILMPFSSNGETIDFLYGVISWKEVASSALTDDIHRAIGALSPAVSVAADMPIWADGPSSEDHGRQDDDCDHDEEESDGAVLELTDAYLPFAATRAVANAVMDNAMLADTLCDSLAEAQGAAADAISAEGRTRQALYRALALAHAFALISQKYADDYAALLDDAEIRMQPRSPMTALVKLVFGAHYDKTRLSEFSIAIDHAIVEGIAPGALGERLSRYPGALKAYVRDARAAKRGETAPRADRTAQARARLVQAPAIAPDAVITDADGLAVVVMRRTPDGELVPVVGVAADDRRVAQLVRAIASKT